MDSVKDFIDVIDVLWKVFPAVWDKALLVFVMVGLLKSVGVIKPDVQSQLANLIGVFAASGGKFPHGEYTTVSLWATAFLAAFYHKLWVTYVKDFFVSLLDKVKGSLKPE